MHKVIQDTSKKNTFVLSWYVLKIILLVSCNIKIHCIMYQFICQIHIDPVLTLIISAPNVLPPSFYSYQHCISVYLHRLNLLTLALQQQVSILPYTPARNLDQGLLMKINCLLHTSTYKGHIRIKTLEKKKWYCCSHMHLTFLTCVNGPLKTHPYLWNIFYERSIKLVNSVTVELRRSRDELD